MKYTDYYQELYERYSGSKMLRGIWYHGTSAKYLPSILSNGLIPNSKEKSWDVDNDTSINSIDRTSYGGIYVTKNLNKSTGAAWRTARKTKSNELIVIMELQSKSLIVDEDSISNYLSNYIEVNALHLYKVIKYGTEHAEYSDYAKSAMHEWSNKFIKQMDYEYSLNDHQKSAIQKILTSEGFIAMLTRIVSYTSDEWIWKRHWNNKENIPKLPPKSEGESMFRNFIDKLTKTMKFIVRKKSIFKSARSLEPIRFSGSNKIIAIIEIIDGSNKIKLHYGKLPNEFIEQYRSEIDGGFSDTNIINGTGVQQ